MTSMSWMYPKGPIDIHQYLYELPQDNSVPGLTEWKYIHTPGHSPGHISLFRERDKVLIAGDAFVTTKAESAVYALTHMKHLSGPPKYFTCNWASAELSVIKLAALDPEVAATGHGKPMRGIELRNALNNLSKHFEAVAVPAQGRYVNEPAVTDENGVVSVPPPVQRIPLVLKVMGLSLALLSAAYLVYQQARRREEEEVADLTRALFQLPDKV